MFPGDERRRQIDRYDVVAAVGFLLLAAGLAIWSVPAALCVSGGLLLALGVLGSRDSGA